MKWLSDFKCDCFRYSVCCEFFARSINKVNIILSALRDNFASRRYNLVGIIDINAVYVKPMYTKTMSIIIPGVKNNLSNVLSGAGNCVVDIVGNFIKLVYVSTGVINDPPALLFIALVPSMALLSVAFLLVVL